MPVLHGSCLCARAEPSQAFSQHGQSSADVRTRKSMSERVGKGSEAPPPGCEPAFANLPDAAPIFDPGLSRFPPATCEASSNGLRHLCKILEFWVRRED